MIPILIASTVLISQGLPYAAKDLVFQSEKAVQNAGTQFLTGADSDLNRFVELSKQGNYSNAYQIWSDLLFRYFSLKLELGKTEQLSLSDKVKASSTEEKQLLEKKFQQKLSSHSSLFSTLLNNAEASGQLTPQQRLFTEALLKEYQETHVQEAKKIAEVLEKISTEDVASYAYAKGVMGPINADALQELKVFSANICCFPGTLSYMYGGVSPWQQRIDKLVEVICNSKAQIVCLQEVWDPEAMRALIGKLKNEYTFFIYDAGDPAGTLNVSKMGYSSGLFVASKLALDSIAFKRFPRSIPEGSNRGAILAICRVAKERIAFINTHLNHASAPQQKLMREVRQEQLLLCYGYLQELVSRTLSTNSWGFLAGDFNIDAFSTEFNDCGLSRLFAIPYAQNLSNEKPTWTDYFNDLVTAPPEQRDKVVPVNELVDYCIRPTLSHLTPKMTQTLVPLYDLKKPVEALSDHQALLTTWTVSSGK
jgi:endonuclease/exonuclease/phosphatase family metal-dependent hydrolase